MCGIIGIIDYSSYLSKKQKKEKWLGKVQKMSQLISHRGRDGHGTFIDNHGLCFFGHRRLSILDLSNNASQPMYSNDGRYVITFNGEIYNFKELKKELEKEGIIFTSSSDTQVLLYSYIVWGNKCLQKLRGIFAFAIWDSKEKKLFAARDHLGVKPFYWSYTKKNGQEIFIFASEIKAMLQSGLVEKKIDLQALESYLTFYSVAAPLTIIKDVFMLKPGYCIEFCKGSIKFEKYWDLKKIGFSENFSTFEKAKNAVHKKLYESVRLQMCSDVPVGAFLSGGIDSATIVGIMKEFTEKKINTFTIGFGKEGGYLDESLPAFKVAKTFDCNHLNFTIGKDFFKKNFNEFIKAMDQPTGDGLNSFFVSKLAGDHLRVALSGLGGDELFLGYRYFQDVLKLQNFASKSFGKKILPFLNKTYNKNSLVQSIAYRTGFNFARFRTFSPTDIYFSHRTLFKDESISSLLNFNLVNNKKNCNYNPEYILGNDNLNDLNLFSKLELSYYTTNMLLRDMDAMSMWSNLEVRVPFLDHKLVELLLKIPSKFKIYRRQETNKPLLVNAFKKLLPEDIIKSKKRGFEMPVGFWLMESFGKELKELENVSWINKSYIRKLLSDFYKNPKSYLKIWTIFVLVKWIKEYGVEFEFETKSFSNRSHIHSTY